MEEEETVESYTVKPMMKLLLLLIRNTCVPYGLHALSIVFLLATIG
jgi:hypothetical protein